MVFLKLICVSNKRAKLDLDSALLWHCRLGHISKKRIEKLQHDGLLDSTDLMAFEKCVSCMSGKMERKPYTHQVERAKDLLRLIHTDDHGIIAHRTPHYTPQHNGMSERRNRTLLDMVRSMMSQTTLPKSFWDYALETAARILNMALVKQDTLTNPDKLEPRSIKCIFIGYPKETMGYSFYYPPENKVLVARNAKFIENSLINQEAKDDLEIDEPQSDIVPIRRSTRTRHAPDRMCLYIDAKEHELGDLGEPANYKAALLDHESEKWLNAINVEMQSMKDNEVWVLVELPPNGKTVGSKWLFKKKTDMDGVVHTYKARLVAKGYTQTPGIDYDKTFSLFVDIRAIRILIAITAYYDYEIYIHMQEKLKLSKSQGASTPAELKRIQNVPYASAMGSIMYATGYVFVLNGGAVDWKSAKQSIFATSSAEAEYIVAFDASKEAVWVRKLIYGLGVVPTIEEPISMYCNNTGAIVIANKSGITKGAKHVCAKVHYLREVIEYGDIKLEKVHTNDNLVDPFTKALAFPKHLEHTRNIGMLPASSL
nr:hypothetical protein [Tanacetum cinerariifolium]